MSPIPVVVEGVGGRGKGEGLNVVRRQRPRGPEEDGVLHLGFAVALAGLTIIKRNDSLHGELLGPPSAYRLKERGPESAAALAGQARSGGPLGDHLFQVAQDVLVFVFVLDSRGSGRPEEEVPLLQLVVSLEGADLLGG